VVEEGADGFAPGDEELRGLIEQLRLSNDLVAPHLLPTLVLERVNGKRALGPAATPGTAIPPLTLRPGTDRTALRTRDCPPPASPIARRAPPRGMELGSMRPPGHVRGRRCAEERVRERSASR